MTWAAAPGYVSWCPLGFDNRPVFAFSVNVGNPWLGWVVVPRTHFGAPGAYVHHHAVPHLPATAPVVLQAAAPVLPRAATRPTARRRSPPRWPCPVHRVETSRFRGAAGTQPMVVQSPRRALRRLQAAISHRRLGANPAASGLRGRSDRGPSRLISAERAASGVDQAVGRSPAEAIKVPLAKMPLAYQRSAAAAIPHPMSGDTNARAVERSSSRLASPWYGQSPAPSYSGAGRAAPRATPNDPAAVSATDGAGRWYGRGPVGAPVAPQQAPMAAPAPQGGAPRWGAPAAVQRAQPIYAPPPAQPSAPASPAMRAPAPSAPVAVPRGSAPGQAPSTAPAGAPAREAAPRHAPSSRRPS